LNISDSIEQMVKPKPSQVGIDFMAISKKFNLQMKEIIWLNSEFKSMLDITEKLASVQAN